MSVVGYKVRNHPQQVAARGALSSVDDRATSPDFFATLDVVHGFTLDVAASAENAKCQRYFTAEQDGLRQSWAGEVVWCHAPEFYELDLRVFCRVCSEGAIGTYLALGLGAGFMAVAVAVVARIGG